MLQAAAFRTTRDRFQNEFDRAASIGSDQLLDRFLAYCKLKNLKPRFSLHSYDGICAACANGDLRVLQWWKESGLYFPTRPLPLGNPLNLASKHGNVAVLQWYKDSGWPLHYTSMALDDASKAGHVPVLQWWKDSGLPLKFERAIAYASSNNRINVLQWWKDSKLLLRGGANDLDNVSSVEVLEWWKRSGLDMRCGRGLVYASVNGNLAVLDWWRSSGLKLTHIDSAVDSACRVGNLASLQWWKDSGLDVCYTLKDYWNLNPAVLQWWSGSGWPAVVHEHHLIQASAEGRLDVLQLWKSSDLNTEYNEKSLNCALLSGNVSALRWWKESGLELKFTASVTKKLGHRSAARKWLKENGLT
ncbi:hypothetical protein DFJ73DRAFT_631169 [Zopfochytrium polystomum]|nr:hypothetical protein DFJ73DRAFT_631169 [Zopfochytrium polystomum]